MLAVFGSGCSDTETETAAASSTASPPPAAPAPSSLDAGHRRIDRLIGDWTVEKYTYVAGGTPEKPLTSHDIVSHWRWIAKTGNNFLQEEAEGSLSGKHYYRLGTLGYSPTDNRYEWATVDDITPMMMTYKGVKGSGDAADISMTGEFTDPACSARATSEGHRDAHADQADVAGQRHVRDLLHPARRTGANRRPGRVHPPEMSNRACPSIP